MEESARKRYGYRWTPEEERLLLELKTFGFSYREIAEKLGRSRRAVYERLRLIRERRMKQLDEIIEWCEKLKETPS